VIEIGVIGGLWLALMLVYVFIINSFDDS